MSLAAAWSVYKILVVEDEDSSRNLLSLLLAAEGYEIQQARDGEDALLLLRSMSFDLVLADVVMPNLDGLGLMARVRLLAPSTRVMLMTGYIFGSSQNLGADEFITKPFTFEELRHKIRQVLRKNLQPRVRDH